MAEGKRLGSYINEIRAYDIYTLNSSSSEVPNDYHSLFLPGVSGSSSWDTPLEPDPQMKSRYLMKKLYLLQGKKPCNLPVLQEEDGGSLSKSPESTMGMEMPMQGGTLTEGDYESTSEDDVNDEYDDNTDDIYVLDDVSGSMSDESWVDLSKQASEPSGNSSPFARVYSSSQGPTMSSSPATPERVTPPPFGNGEEYLRLLREAQRESNQSSPRVSLASSRRDTPRDSPKSPPNSPNTEVVLENEDPSVLQGVYINYYNRDGDFVRVEKNVESDWIWDWSSRPDQTPPKEWKFVHPKRGILASRRGASIRRLMVGNSSLFSRDVLYTLFITNVLSLLLGTGIGMWLSRKSGGGGGGGSGANVPLALIPIN